MDSRTSILFSIEAFISVAEELADKRLLQVAERAKMIATRAENPLAEMPCAKARLDIQEARYRNTVDVTDLLL